LSLKTAFPEAGSDYQGGTSDGWEYRVVFTGNRLTDVYAMVSAFLEEEGYGDMPIPSTAEELRCFKSPKSGLFDLTGYVHNPIKILFLPAKSRRVTLGLYVYNEASEGHLLRFHGVASRLKKS
jgi:hypothetical protein